MDGIAFIRALHVRNCINECLTQSVTDEVSDIVSIAEPSGGLRLGEVDAIVRVVGPKRFPKLLCRIQVVIVADIEHAVAEHEDGRWLLQLYLAVGSCTKHLKRNYYPS